MKSRLLFCFAALFTASGPLAHEGVKDPYVLKRMDSMKDVAQEMKALGAIAKDPAKFDPSVIDQHAGAVVDQARSIPTLFEYNANDPMSEARETIWSDWQDFLKEAEAMETAAEALGRAPSHEAFSAAFSALGDTCTSCHKSYRIKK